MTHPGDAIRHHTAPTVVKALNGPVSDFRGEPVFSFSCQADRVSCSARSAWPQPSRLRHLAGHYLARIEHHRLDGMDIVDIDPSSAAGDGVVLIDMELCP